MDNFRVAMPQAVLVYIYSTNSSVTTDGDQ